MNNIEPNRPAYLYQGEYIIPRRALQQMRAVWLREQQLDKPDDDVVD